MFISRRHFLSLSIANVYVRPVIGGLSPSFGADSGIAGTDQPGLTPEGWMSSWMEVASRQPGASLYLSRFRDHIYFLLREISWSPNPDQASSFQSVVVPKGFVTDLASIPRVFWSLLRPDGEYAYSAIIHDYMYWMQNPQGRPRIKYLYLACRILISTLRLFLQFMRQCGLAAKPHGRKTSGLGKLESAEF